MRRGQPGDSWGRWRFLGRPFERIEDEELDGKVRTDVDRARVGDHAAACRLLDDPTELVRQNRRAQRDGGVPEEERPLAEAGEGESEGVERAEELLEERSEAEG
jgi:hypothetical protein